MWPEIIDFKYFPYSYAEFNPNTQEYAALNELQDEEWDNYLFEMSRNNSGIDIRYDNVDDVFIIESSQGIGKYFGTPISQKDEESSVYEEPEVEESGKYFDKPADMYEGKKKIVKEGTYSDYDTEEINSKGEKISVSWTQGEVESVDGRVKQCWAIGKGSDGSEWSATVDVCYGEWGELEDKEEIKAPGDKTSFKDGDIVTIEFEPGVTSEGVVENVHSDGTLDITWEDGSRNENVKPSEVQSITFNESEDKEEDKRQMLLGDKDEDEDSLIEAILNEPLEELEIKEGEKLEGAELEFDEVKDSEESRTEGPDYAEEGPEIKGTQPKETEVKPKTVISKTVEVKINPEQEENIKTENKMSEKKQITEADDDKRISSAFQTLALSKKALEEANTQLVINLGYHFQKLYEMDLTEINNTIESARKQIEVLSRKIRTQLKR